VGALIWAAERKRNAQQFPPEPLAGIGNGIWFALVTMTTVGYGDRAPVTAAGRVVAGVWMVIALVTASSLTAGIATALTLARLSPSRIATLDLLAVVRVAVVRGPPRVAFARRSHARVVVTSDLESAVQRVVRGEAEAVVYDRPMLLHYLQENPEADFIVSDARYIPQSYGFALPLDTDLQHDLNVALLRANETGLVAHATKTWLGTADDETGLR
jgi:polar amino acid transport system substrate-binding protein